MAHNISAFLYSGKMQRVPWLTIIENRNKS